MPSSEREHSESSPLLQSTASLDSAGATRLQKDAPQNRVTGVDLAWVLAGLWSAVFLGALDGKPFHGPYSRTREVCTCPRNHCRDAAGTDWQLLPRVQPIIVYWHLVPVVRMLFHPSIRYVCCAVTRN